MEDNVSRFLCAALIAAASISAAPALAQDSYPNKPIKIVLPVPPGSALDIATRAIGEQLSVRWGQQVLIEARPGAGGLIAGQAVASAPELRSAWHGGRQRRHVYRRHPKARRLNVSGIRRA